MDEISLSSLGLETVPEACARKGWAAKTVQLWIKDGRLPAAILGRGRGATYLLRKADVDAFERPPRGRPKKAERPKKK